MNPFEIIQDALIWRRSYETLRCEPWGKDSLRVRVTHNPFVRDDLPHALLEPEPAQVSVEVSQAGAVMINGRLRLEVSPGGGLHFLDGRSGRELLAELQPYTAFIGPWPREFKPLGSDLFRIDTWFVPRSDERFYGLGQQQHGRLDQKGCVIELLQRNSRVSIPFLLSNRGYGFLWNNPAVGRVELGHNGTHWVAEAAQQMDYWVTLGDTPAEILEHYTGVTGRAPLLPAWAAGFWQCKLRYRTQEELLDVAREYHRRGLPLSVIVIDYFHWTVQGDWKFDPQAWPDPAGMVRELESLGVKLMVSIWPTVQAMSENYSEMDDLGFLVRSERGVNPQHHMVDTRPEGRVYQEFYDATHPAARQYVWAKVEQNYYRHGVKLWWLDACEPEIAPVHPENLRFYAGPGLATLNLYPRDHARAFYEGMQSCGETDILSLCRSAWAGSQRYAAAVWSGDIPSTFEALQVQVRAGLNIGLSGIPWWTTDIGGFHSGDPSTPYFRELIVRWFQFGTFCPLFRLHGARLPGGQGAGATGASNEAWSFGEPASTIIRDLLTLREKLRPYILRLMKTAHESGAPPMRPLFFDFPGDEASWAIEDQFMFGPDLLVAPVLHQGAVSRTVYLPAGADWVDAWSGTEYHGGQAIQVDAPLQIIPLYLRLLERRPQPFAPPLERLYAL